MDTKRQGGKPKQTKRTQNKTHYSSVHLCRNRTEPFFFSSVTRWSICSDVNPSFISSLPVIPASLACSVRLSKQIGHFTCTAAVIGKKMGHCSKNISPGHGSQIGWFSDMADAYVADNLGKAPLFDTL